MRGRSRRSQGGDGGSEALERFALLVPAGDQADLARTPIVKIETLRAEPVGFGGRDVQEDLVGFHRIDQSLRCSP